MFRKVSMLVAIGLAVIGLALSVSLVAVADTPVGTAFTYQGYLTDNGSAANGDYDFKFDLYDAVTGGNLEDTLTMTPTTVTDGVFTVQLDFGSDAFTGDARWLEISIRQGGGAYSDPIDPRTALTPAPYALHAVDAWAITGNSGTTYGTHFLGTTDEVSLTLAVSGTAALRLEPAVHAMAGFVPNVVGGYSGNSVTSGAVGATIGGGGVSIGPNTVTDIFGAVGGGMANTAGSSATVGGGEANTASGASATVGGGSGNTASGQEATVGGGSGNEASYQAATVGGGDSNTASNLAATVGGGDSNTASGWYATVGGGKSNTASGDYATVPGGSGNEATDYYSFAAGRRAKANHDGAFVWADSTDADFASSANDQFMVQATGGVSLTVDTGGGGLRLEPNATSPNVIGGHSDNSVTSGVVGATIGGGGESGNANSVTDDYGTVGGGRNNQAGDADSDLDNADYATVGGGDGNTASDDYATVGGGYGNTASGDRATVGGGANNQASSSHATVSGGYQNTASVGKATVGGGMYNTASNDRATVGGGGYNTASGDYATVGGGEYNTASGQSATVGGGYTNVVTGTYATVPGGNLNEAVGNYSFAAGRRAKANNQGCFVWGDSTNDDVTCDVDNAFIVRASGGITMYTDSGLTSGMYMAAGDSSWNAVSDRERKENFAPVDALELLARLAENPITTWNYKAQDPSIRHIGPMAQDFNALIEGLGGEGEKYINTLDADGVALAAVQGLYQLSQEQAARIEELEAENAALQGWLGDLEARLAALEAAAQVDKEARP